MSLEGAVGILLASIALWGPVAQSAPACPDSLKFLKSHCAEWQADILPQQLPPAAGNAFADRDDAAALGMKIFYDNRFSQAGSGVSCASCHDPEHAFSEVKPRSHTLKEVARNAPALIDAAWYSQSHFWDGKVDNLWSAPLFTMEQEDEMGSSRLHVVHSLAAIYKARYEKIFGSLPDFSDPVRFPASGKPGTAAFDAMSNEDKLAVNRVYADVGKALEAYIRKLAAGRSPFDDFMAGSAISLTPSAQRGMVAFTRHGCNRCHSGPTFSDEQFHNLGLPTAAGQSEDSGREGGQRYAQTWQFTSTSQFADAFAGERAPGPKAGNQHGAFRTPSLRNVALTPPYGHDGTLGTLEEAMDAHARSLPGHAAPDAQDERDIADLLRSLSGRPPQSPWKYWPGG